jgi:hypothetical protein
MVSILSDNAYEADKYICARQCVMGLSEESNNFYELSNVSETD